MSEVKLKNIVDKRTANAFLFGNLFNQQQTSSKSFDGPFVLEKRIGLIDPEFIVNYPYLELLDAMHIKPAIHPMVKIMTQRLVSACELLIEKYNEDARNIWNSVDSETTLKRLQEFSGIGLHKAQVALFLLNTHLQNKHEDLNFNIEEICPRLSTASIMII